VTIVSEMNRITPALSRTLTTAVPLHKRFRVAMGHEVPGLARLHGVQETGGLPEGTSLWRRDPLAPT
jgi:hypothetical protein